MSTESQYELPAVILELKRKLLDELQEMVILLQRCIDAFPKTDTDELGITVPLVSGIEIFKESVEFHARLLREASSLDAIGWQSLSVMPSALDFDQVGLSVREGSVVRLQKDLCNELALALYDQCKMLAHAKVTK